MFKRALLKCNCIIKQSALKILSTKQTIRAKESRNIQGTAVNNVENSNQKNFKHFFQFIKKEERKNH